MTSTLSATDLSESLSGPPSIRPTRRRLLMVIGALLIVIGGLAAAAGGGLIAVFGSAGALALSDPGGRHTGADLVDDARAVTVRDDPWKRHRRAEPTARFFASPRLTPECVSRTRTSPSAGTGSGTSPTTSTSAAGPCRSYHAALIGAASPVSGTTLATLRALPHRKAEPRT